MLYGDNWKLVVFDTLHGWLVGWLAGWLAG